MKTFQDFDRAVIKELEAGVRRLPILVVDGAIVTTGIHPAREQLAEHLGLPANTDFPEER